MNYYIIKILLDKSYLHFTAKDRTMLTVSKHDVWAVGALKKINTLQVMRNYEF